MSALEQSSLAMGLADPVFGSQHVFRTLLNAFAAPGTPMQISDTLSGVPDSIPSAAAAVLLTMADYETPVWLSQPFDGIRPWLAFHTSAPMPMHPADARFAVVSADFSELRLDAFSLGDERYPDTSATIIIICPTLENGHPVTLKGPGIKDATVFAPQGIERAMWKQIADNNALFPLGVDLIFVAGSSLAALPRSTRIIGDF